MLTGSLNEGQSNRASIFEAGSSFATEFKAAVPPGTTESQAIALLESHPHFHGRSHWVQFRFSNGRLYMSGRLPSFYLKQVAQEAVRKLPKVEEVVNRIKVVSPGGQIAPKQLGSVATIRRKPR